MDSDSIVSASAALGAVTQTWTRPLRASQASASQSSLMEQLAQAAPENSLPAVGPLIPVSSESLPSIAFGAVPWSLSFVRVGDRDLV
jgi:hypothetical protein